MGVLCDTKERVALGRSVAVAIEAKGLPDDRRRRRHISDTARASLMRLERSGRVQRVVREPETWRELV